LNNQEFTLSKFIWEIRGKKVKKIHTTTLQSKAQIAHKITKIANP